MAISAIVKTGAKIAMQGANAYGNYSSYKYEREKGKSPVGAIIKTAAESVLFAACPPAGMALLAGNIIGGAITGTMAYAQGGGRQAVSSIDSVYRSSFGGNFVDTENAQTMRQRGLQAIQMSGNNLNQVFGSEARTFYRGIR